MTREIMSRQIYYIHLMRHPSKNGWRNDGPVFSTEVELCGYGKIRTRSVPGVAYTLLAAKDNFGILFSAQQHAERAICYRPSVCPSVRPSVTRVDQSKTVERIIETLSPSGRPNILVFRHQRSLRKSDGFTPNGGAKYKEGSKN